MTILDINGDKYEYENYVEAEKAIIDALRYWNNFGDHTPLQFNISKTEDPNALHARTKDHVDTTEAVNRHENPTN